MPTGIHTVDLVPRHVLKMEQWAGTGSRPYNMKKR